MNKQPAQPIVPGARLARAAIALAVGLALLTAPGCGPSAPPTCREVGQTWTRPADGMVMVCVPAGAFTMGSAEAARAAKPQHEVYLEAYWIDRTEVTNAQYRRCVEAGACAEPGYWDNTDYNATNQPVVGVSWDDAAAYCAWAGSALPTEAQWEKAARGTDGRVYPWGHAALTCELANFRDCVGRPAAVGSYPAGASPYGALDLAGNVWEWTSSLFADYPYRADDGREDLAAQGKRVLRGGTWVHNTMGVRAAFRFWREPPRRSVYLGFRCAVPARGTP